MPNLLNIEIAGVNFIISSRDKIHLDELPLTYQPFLVKTPPLNGLNIHISPTLHEMPNIKKMRKIFNTGHAWSMFFHDNEYLLALMTPTEQKKLVWLAQCNCKFEKVTIYCSDILSTNTDKGTKLLNPIRYPLDQIILMHFLAHREGCLIHAAGAEFNGRGFIFPGKSGVGKSTLTRQLDCISGFSLLSDDRVVVRKTGNTFKAFGTPWPGEAGIALNRGIHLSGLFFISHANYNKIEEIDSQKALERLLPLVSIPWYDKETMIKILDFCGELISHIPTYDFLFKPGIEVIHVFEKFVSK